ncbi:peptidoglycan DD-metalloendopeptidase family protein [Saccharospirillum mangrovi]|uniref:peptidoglycan DD-metalloendopeptidase family protein n=1 Tax=Saccharospirillum mangrovi TaxID=2161747 RepID=UPI0013009D26|nr:peptidoglycan DD-metalloendopeptidase family protein [Saccharospirillum mangrovi]
MNRIGRKASKFLTVTSIVVLLTACLNNPAYRSLDGNSTPFTSRNNTNSGSSSQDRPARYQVRSGDTLFSIAFRYGLDYRKLANANNIDSSYTIFAGQVLELREAERSGGAVSSTNQSRPSRSNGGSSSSVTNGNSQNSGVNASTANSAAEPAIQWVWPHDGTIVRTFNANVSDRKGVDIGGQFGDSVKAAAEGTVVYAGNGLPGYGNLIILEHSHSLLSAYAFNQELLVSEQDRVRKGQEIARMGRQGDQPGLHFEIRREGKPVNPEAYLPRR